MSIKKGSGGFYNSGGKYKTRIKGVKTHSYAVWRGMIRRCYKEEMQDKHPTYIGCFVCDEWHDFQVFAEWVDNQKYGSCGYQLDKDILVSGNRVYSPEACCFIPSELNTLLIDSGASRGDYPQGVSLRKDVNKFQAGLRMGGKLRHIGYFKCPQEAHQAYKSAKERYVKNRALSWANKIDWDVFVSFMNWQLKS